MRHRRRLTTQTIQRKNSTGTFQAYQKQKKSKAGKYFLSVLILALIIVAAVIYKDDIMGLLPFKNFDFSIGNTNSTNTEKEVQRLPVEKEVKEEPIPFTPIQKRIQVEVLNGCGVPGIAKKFSDHLKKNNYDVVNSGNYLENGRVNFNVSKTRIIDQIKSPENITRANELADLLEIDQNLIESFENPSPIADLTLVIGKDYDQITFKEN